MQDLGESSQKFLYFPHVPGGLDRDLRFGMNVGTLARVLNVL